MLLRCAKVVEVNEEEEVINPILTRRGKDPVLVMKVATSNFGCKLRRQTSTMRAGQQGEGLRKCMLKGSNT
jgi:hypothetical protein